MYTTSIVAFAHPSTRSISPASPPPPPSPPPTTTTRDGRYVCRACGLADGRAGTQPGRLLPGPACCPSPPFGALQRAAVTGKQLLRRRPVPCARLMPKSDRLSRHHAAAEEARLSKPIIPHLVATVRTSIRHRRLSYRAWSVGAEHPATL